MSSQLEQSNSINSVDSIAPKEFRIYRRMKTLDASTLYTTGFMNVHRYLMETSNGHDVQIISNQIDKYKWHRLRFEWLYMDNKLSKRIGHELL